MQPVTTYTTNYVDQGGFVDQTLVTPGPTRTRLRWLQNGCVTDPATGVTAYQRGGLTWVPEQCPAKVETFRVWQPNVVAQQVPQTSFVPQVMVRKVPVQVCRMVEEQLVRKVPVQVCRMVQEEHVRNVPVTTYRQVVERVEQQTPIQVCKMVEEEHVRRIPVTTCRMVTEEHVEQIPVQVCTMEAVEQTVRIPRYVEKQVPVTYLRQVPRVVVMRVPIDPCGDPCCGTETVIAAPAAVRVIAPPAQVVTPPPTGTYQPQVQPQRPTPAVPRRGAERPADENEAPALGPGEGIGPVDEEVDGVPGDLETIPAESEPNNKI
jgi:hypothetical protein